MAGDVIAVFGALFFGLGALTLLAVRFLRKPVAVIAEQGL